MTKELINGANKDNAVATSNNGRRVRFRTAAMEITRMERTANSFMHKYVAELLKDRKYGYAPREKPKNCFHRMFKNWNSLGFFTGQGKINTINDLIRKYEVDCIAGCEPQCNWMLADEDQQF